jgi:hypothetical protein
MDPLFQFQVALELRIRYELRIAFDFILTLFDLLFAEVEVFCTVLEERSFLLYFNIKYSTAQYFFHCRTQGEYTRNETNSQFSNSSFPSNFLV